ncbi:MAG TPA: GspE/PulE family protein [Bacteroidota bacterium]|nr:GspE/PulE family protein [Bacteroidota bacterium]
MSTDKPQEEQQSYVLRMTGTTEGHAKNRGEETARPRQPVRPVSSAQLIPKRAEEGGVSAGPRKLPARRLVDRFIEQGIVTKEKIEQVLEIQRKLGPKEKKRILDILIDDVGVDSDAILKIVAEHYSFESVDPNPVLDNKEHLQSIREQLDSLTAFYYEMAIRLKVLPFEIQSNGVEKLVLITPDPTHPDVHTVARAFRFQKYEIKHVTLQHWNELWRRITFDQGAKSLGFDDDEFMLGIEKDETDKEMEQSLEDEIGRGKLNELIENVFIEGTRTGASDIHVIPKDTYKTEFHFRIDGRLSLWSTINDVRSEAVITVVKDHAKNLDRFEKLLSQDGFAQRTIDNKIVRFRFSTMPIYSGDLRSKLESVVIRILRDARSNTIESLGMPPESSGPFLKAIRKTQGIVIFTGPTGSGKSTSQFAAIQTIMDPGINILTIEDPVEYVIEGCRQVKLNYKLDFEGALRGILRHDPDVVMVGEMRDKTTAEIAIKLANTGHLIFSTLHTNDSVSAITRLYNMGIEPFLLAYTINIIIAQRLVRRLCDRCKVIDEEIDHELLLASGLTDKEIETGTFYKPVGCVHCIRGFRGRIGIFETLVLSKDIRKMIMKSRDFIDEDAIRTTAMQNGMQTLRKSAIDLIRSGITSIENVEGLIEEE